MGTIALIAIILGIPSAVVVRVLMERRERRRTLAALPQAGSGDGDADPLDDRAKALPAIAAED